jgi:hypothetical protein
MRTITEQEQALVAGGNVIGNVLINVGGQLMFTSETVRGVPVVGPTAAAPIYQAGYTIRSAGCTMNSAEHCAQGWTYCCGLTCC